MNTRAFMLALIIAGVAMFMVHTYIEDQKKVMIEKYGREVSVVVARADINELDLMDDTKVVTKSVPKSFVAPGAIQDPKEVENTVAAVPILKGEQITKPRIIYPGGRTGLARQVSIDKRAISIPITEQEAVSKLIKPGDRVDVLAAIDYAGRADLRSITTILQNVLVLSTGISMTNAIPIMGVKTPTVIKKMKLNTYSQYNTVTLELTPYDVQKIYYVLRYTTGRPFLSLRNNNDLKNIRIKSTKIFDILGDEANRAKTFFKNRYEQEDRGRGGK